MMEKAKIINESIAKEKKKEYQEIKTKKRNEKNEEEHKKRLEKLKFSLDKKTIKHIFSENHFIQ